MEAKPSGVPEWLLPASTQVTSESEMRERRYHVALESGSRWGRKVKANVARVTDLWPQPVRHPLGPAAGRGGRWCGACGGGCTAWGVGVASHRGLAGMEWKGSMGEQRKVVDAAEISKQDTPSLPL